MLPLFFSMIRPKDEKRFGLEPEARATPSTGCVTVSTSYGITCCPYGGWAYLSDGTKVWIKRDEDLLNSMTPGVKHVEDKTNL